MKKFFKNLFSKIRIGIEISEQFLRAVEYRSVQSTWVMSRVFEFALQGENREIAQLNALKTLRAYYTRAPLVIMGLTQQLSIVKNQKLDIQINATEAYRYFKQKYAGYFNSAASQISIDCRSLPSFPHDTQTTWQLIAAKQAEIEKLQKLALLTGFHLQAIDIEVLALLRALNYYEKLINDKKSFILIVHVDQVWVVSLNRGGVEEIFTQKLAEDPGEYNLKVIRIFQRAFNLLAAPITEALSLQILITQPYPGDYELQQILQQNNTLLNCQLIKLDIQHNEPAVAATNSIAISRRFLLAAGLALWGIYES